MTKILDYRLSLRIGHPRLHGEKIAENFSLVPEVLHTTGLPRISAKGAQLPGTYEKNYVVFSLTPPDPKPALEELIEKTMVSGKLATKEYMIMITKTGGFALLFASLFLDCNSGIEFPHTLMGRLGDWKIDLGLDVYPNFEEAKD